MWFTIVRSVLIGATVYLFRNIIPVLVCLSSNAFTIFFFALGFFSLALTAYAPEYFTHCCWRLQPTMRSRFEPWASVWQCRALPTWSRTNAVIFSILSPVWEIRIYWRWYPHNSRIEWRKTQLKCFLFKATLTHNRAQRSSLVIVVPSPDRNDSRAFSSCKNRSQVGR